MAIPVKNVLGNANVTEGNFQIAIEQLRESVIGSGKAYDSANTYMINDTCSFSGIIYYSKIDNNTGNTPVIGANWGVNVVQNTGNETIAGVKTFSSSPIVPVPTLVNQVISMGNIVEKTSAGIGYGNGSGGTVTQLTSKSTTVALHKPCGQITMNNASLSTNTWVGFALINSLVSADDRIVVNLIAGSTVMNLYEVKARPQAGSIAIDIRHTYGTPLSEAMVIGYSIIKGATA